MVSGGALLRRVLRPFLFLQRFFRNLQDRSEGPVQSFHRRLALRLGDRGFYSHLYSHLMGLYRHLFVILAVIECGIRDSKTLFLALPAARQSDPAQGGVRR